MDISTLHNIITILSLSCIRDTCFHQFRNCNGFIGFLHRCVNAARRRLRACAVDFFGRSLWLYSFQRLKHDFGRFRALTASAIRGWTCRLVQLAITLQLRHLHNLNNTTIDKTSWQFSALYEPKILKLLD